MQNCCSNHSSTDLDVSVIQCLFTNISVNLAVIPVDGGVHQGLAGGEG